MSFYDTAMSALDAKDFQSISKLMHEDFIWMDGYDVKTLDEWLVGLKSEFEKTDWDQAVDRFHIQDEVIKNELLSFIKKI